MIRAAKIEDFEQILDLCEEFWEHTQFTEPFERAHTLDMVKMSYDHGLLCVMDKDGVKGFCAAVKSFLLGSTKALSATELAWWIAPSHRNGGAGIRLLKFMEAMAKAQGVKYWSMASMESSMPEQINRMYRKMGYVHTETTFTKVI